MSKICLAIMAKHEAQTIEKVVEFCRPFVDHVLISVDSKSTDGTREIANEIADTVRTHVFASEESPHGSFAKSRQSLIDTGRKLGYDWILQMDGHEYLYCNNGVDFHSLIKDHPDVDVFHFNLKMGSTKIRQARLHSSDPHLQYKGDIHNVLSGTQKEYFCGDVEIDHSRVGQPKEHVQERDVQRAEMSDKILNQKIQDNPNDSRSMFYLAQSYKETGRMEEAIEMFYRYLGISKFIAEKWNARNYLYHCLWKIGRIEEAYKVIEDSFEDQERAEAHIILGDRAYEGKRYEEALEFYKKANKTPKPRHYVFINEGDYTWAPHDKMSMCFSHKGNFIEAIRHAAKAIKEAPEQQIDRLTNNIIFWTKDLRDKVETIVKFE